MLILIKSTLGEKIMIKHEWRKHEKDIYVPKAKPELIKVPNQKFIR
jgi:hypothetical protein